MPRKLPLPRPPPQTWPPMGGHVLKNIRQVKELHGKKGNKKTSQVRVEHHTFRRNTRVRKYTKDPRLEE